VYGQISMHANRYTYKARPKPNSRALGGYATSCIFIEIADGYYRAVSLD
jgi:hypothetical protein